MSTKIAISVTIFFIAAALLAFKGVRSETRLILNETTQQQDGERFDNLVRADFFAGLDGDKAAFDRAMKLCADTLARNPKHAEAMVWQGAEFVYLAGLAFERRDIRKGGELYERGLKEMDDAVNNEPANVAVLIPRGTTLLEASRADPSPRQA